jgi:hypothetical protein
VSGVAGSIVPPRATAGRSTIAKKKKTRTSRAVVNVLIPHPTIKVT